MRFLIVGCGFYGSTFARIMASFGHYVKIIDKRSHIGGNCYTEKTSGIHVHKYGPHAFHTNSLKVWNFVNIFAKFNDFRLKIIAKNNNDYYNFPVNLSTFNKIYEIHTPKNAISFIEDNKKYKHPENFKEYVINAVGKRAYEILYRDYTKKQWGKKPCELPVSIAKRIPVRFDFCSDYFLDLYQGIPINGYTNLFENMLDHKNIEVELNLDFFENKKEFMKSFDYVIYSGKADEFFEYRHGVLEYRSLSFKDKYFEHTFQGNAVVNHTGKDVKYTRTTEHKFFSDPSVKHSIVTFEYPEKYDYNKTPFYPVESEENKKVFEYYLDLSKKEKNVIFGGRLGRYTYLNMDQVIAMAIKDAENVLCQMKKI